MINSVTEEKVFENYDAERLIGIIKNNYLYPYGPANLSSLRKLLAGADYMYNTEKPHTELWKMTTSMYMKKNK